MKKDSNYTTPQNTDDSKIFRSPLGSGIVSQTVGCDTCKRGHFALVSKAPKMVENTRHDSHYGVTTE